ncbi:hypothetical protein BCR24_06850 [Enterococcus ureilyticus]|uniref:Type VII secretion effector n=1 Tax=Enterococcus ureilyticus TaxID=1131292 RepID=A0A1E5H9F8_9ENTE|nr:TIGR04197 family type VII secretion effector [Enterococcus ureilyticus]MBM7688488.1 type VII secretion effector (TIGR04197 family) [Enterococcus ureilyticus]OEG21583.1 hypothetical protein BCR24_06850 [Enterococcus ureilyticus]
MIDVNGAEAQNQATKIGQANDKLTISQTVTFSSGTTVPGNTTATTTFEEFKTSSTTIQQLLNRDVANIHSAVAAFERADSQTKQLFDRPFTGLMK